MLPPQGDVKSCGHLRHCGRRGSSPPRLTQVLRTAGSIVLLALPAASSLAMDSSHYSIPKLVENNGSGVRVGPTYQLTGDTISPQPVETSTSASYILQGRPLVTVDSDLPSCGIFVNDNQPLTNIVDVDLSLICGHATGCSFVQLSNNGVGWSAPQGYTTSAPWALVANDGPRKVFARFQNGLGLWSGACYDSIVLDRTAPAVGVSPTGGTYMSNQSVALTASEPATVRYTTDGSDPTTSPTALAYGGPITVAADMTIRAYAEDVAGNAGAEVSETYEICTGNNLSISGTVLDATRDNAPMPLVVITLDSGHTANTSLTGEYAFTGLPRGWYTIESVTAPVPGYVTYQAELKLCKTSLDHDLVLTRSGTVYGTDTNSGYSSEGVNTSTGNFAHKVMDLALPGIGPSFVFERTYNSQDGTDGPLGYGWTWSFNVSLAEWPDGEMVMRWGDGKTEVWNPDGAGGWTPMYGVFSTLIENPDGSFTLRGKDLIEYRFDLSNRLATVVDEYGNTISFSYAGDDLTTVVDTSGRTITFSHDASGRITNILDPIGRSVSFTYDVNSDLVSATNMAGKTTTHTYDDAHRMLTITDPMGRDAIANTYDDARSAVVSQRDALGHETRYTYDVPNKVTTIIDAEGNTSHHHFDDRLRLIQEEDARGFSSYRTYDDRGNLDTVTDRNGNVTTFEYDASGNVLAKTEPLGRVTTAAYDTDNNPLTKTDARGHSTVFEYDPTNGNLLATYACGEVPAATCAGDPSVLKTAYTYDPLTGQLLTVTEAAGHPTLERTSTYQYDVEGNNVAVIDALGNTSTYVYDAVGRKVSESHPLGRATAYDYDVMDRLITVVDGLGNLGQYAYDDNGNKTDHWDANLEHTGFTYDEKNRLVGRTDALNQYEEYCYDGVDRRVAITNARGASASVVYDAMGNVVSEIDPMGNTVGYEYDGNGNRTAAINAKGQRKELVYNELNLLVSVTDPLGTTETYEYDLNGNQVSATNALGNTTLSTYDAFNRLETVTDPEGNTVTNTLDLLGRLVTVEDARGHQTHYEYDALDRLVGVTDAEGGTVGAGYDELGNRTSVTDPRGKVTTFEYDVLNRLVSATDPLGNSVVRVYDAVGNLSTLTNADGTTTFEYDHLYRITEVTYPDLTTVGYTYDEVGNRLSVTDSSGVTSFAYDMGDRVASVTDPLGNAVGYTYDPNGNRSSIQYPGYHSVYYLFDELDRVSQVQDWAGVTTTYAYDDAGRLSTQTMGNGVVVTYTYDDAGRLVGKEDRTAGGSVIASYTYTLDPNGNRTGLGYTQPLLPDVDLLDQTMAHNDGNQVTSNNAWTYAYDGKGNRTGATNGAQTIGYAYDFSNRLTSVNDGTNLWQYRYTSNGHRIASSENGVETRWLLDLNGPMELVLAEMTATNAVKRYYVYGDGLLYSVDGTTGESLFYHYDPVGSTVALSDLTGTVTDRYAYLPYGELAGSSGDHENPFTFVGKFGVMREGNGLYFMRARYYDWQTRRFLGKDPVAGSFTDTTSLNPYQYAQQNPLVLSDPSGRFVLLAALAKVAEAYTLANTIWDVGLTFYDASYATSPEQAFNTVIQGLGQIAAGESLPIVGDIAEFREGQLEGQRWRCGPSIGCHLGVSFHQKDGSANATVVTTTVQGELRNAPPAQANAAALSPTVIADAGSGSTVEILADDPGRIRIVNGKTVYPSPEYARYRNMLRWFQGDAAALAGWLERKAKPPGPPTRYLDVAGYAQGQFNEQYRYILAPDFLDQQTLSYVEYRVSSEVASLCQNRYSYTQGDAGEKRRAKERRARDVANSVSSLYAQLISALSKHHVIIRDLSSMPSGATGGIAMTGVYAGGS